jgi:hypothetical protein
MVKNLISFVLASMMMEAQRYSARHSSMGYSNIYAPLSSGHSRSVRRHHNWAKRSKLRAKR